MTCFEVHRLCFKYIVPAETAAAPPVALEFFRCQRTDFDVYREFMLYMYPPIWKLRSRGIPKSRPNVAHMLSHLTGFPPTGGLMILITLSPASAVTQPYPHYCLVSSGEPLCTSVEYALA
jgi:hypothetical protein